MKEIHELQFPDELKYAEDHEWVGSAGESVKIGISDYAQDQLGDIVFVELPEVGDKFEKGAEFGTVESVKAVSELFLPVGGSVVSINGELEDAPEMVNEDPYGKGWMVEIKLDDPSEPESLMSKDAYVEMLKGS